MRKRKDKVRYGKLWLSIKKYLRRSNSQVHGGNVTIWPNDRMMRAAMKKIMVLPAKFARSSG